MSLSASILAAATDRCRLCPATKNLICMFTGKRQATRDTLRKMILECLNIKIEESDEFTATCLNCLVDISNFYYFKLSCLQNQENLKIFAAAPKKKKQKLSTLRVDEIPSPDFETTINISKWLSLKHECLVKVSEQQRTDIGIQATATSSEVYSQCDKPITVSTRSQTYAATLSDVIVQTDSVSFHSVSSQTKLNFISETERKNCGSQTDKLKSMKSRYAQTNFKRFTRDSVSQTESSSYNNDPAQPKTLSSRLFVNSAVFTKECQNKHTQTAFHVTNNNETLCIASQTEISTYKNGPAQPKTLTSRLFVNSAVFTKQYENQHTQTTFHVTNNNKTLGIGSSLNGLVLNSLGVGRVDKCCQANPLTVLTSVSKCIADIPTTTINKEKEEQCIVTEPVKLAGNTTRGRGRLPKSQRLVGVSKEEDTYQCPVNYSNDAPNYYIRSKKYKKALEDPPSIPNNYSSSIVSPSSNSCYTVEKCSIGIQCDVFDYLGGVYAKAEFEPLASSQECLKCTFKELVKEEKLSPLEPLVIPLSPQKPDSFSPPESELLKVKVNKSLPVNICQLCDKIFYSKHGTAKHIRKCHMQCHICKKKFSSVELTQVHVDSCKLELLNTPEERQKLNLLPVVSISKLEDDSILSGKYPRVFHQLRDKCLVTTVTSDNS